MKKKKIVFLSLAAVVLVAAVTVTIILLTNKNNEQSNDIPPIIPQNVIKLSRPKEVNREGTVITWEAVPNATSYIVKVNDLELIAETNSYDISNVVTEGASLSVTAVGVDNYKNSISVKLTPYITVKNEQKINSIAEELYDLYSHTIDLTSDADTTINKGAEELYFLGVTSDDFVAIETFFDNIDATISEDSAISKVVETFLKELGNLNTAFENEAIVTRALFSLLNNYCETYNKINDTEDNKMNTNSLLNPHYEINGVIICNKVMEYLKSIDNLTYESCQILLGYLGKYFFALEQQLPGVIDTLVKAENTEDDFVKSDIDMIFDAFTLKDEIISMLIDDMPSYDDYLSLFNVLSKGYIECAPEFLIEGNPFDLIIEEVEQLYLDNHYTLSFLKYLDADFIQTIKSHIEAVTSTINYEKINELKAYVETENYLFLAMKISELACTKDGKIDLLKAANLQTFLYQLIMDLSSGDEDFMKWIEELILNNLDEASQKIMYEDIISDELLQFIINIVTLGEEPTLEEIYDALAMSDYFKLKEGKEFSDLENALSNISSEQIEQLTTLDFSDYSVEQILIILELTEILEVSVDGYFEYVENLFTDTGTLIDYLSNIESINEIFEDLNFEEAFIAFFDGIGADLVEKYPVLEDSLEYLTNFLNGLGINIATIALKYEEIDTLLFNKEMNFKYVYVAPTITPSENDNDLENVVKKYVLYYIFGHRASIIEKDFDSLIELLDYYYDIIETNKPLREQLNTVVDELLLKLNNPNNLNELIDNLLNLSDEELADLFDYILMQYEELFGFNDQIDYDKLEQIIDTIVGQLPDEYRTDIEQIVDLVFDLLIMNDFENRLNELEEYLIANREVNQDIFDLYQAGIDLSNLEWENLQTYYDEFIIKINGEDYDFDSFVEEYKTNSEYQIIVDEAFDELLISSSESIELIIDEFLKIEESVSQLPEVPEGVGEIFDSLEQIKNDINDYDQFKQDVVSLIEELYNLYK